MNPFNSYPAKLLLFGEYSILLGSRALGMPFLRYSASLRFAEQESTKPRTAESNRQLEKLCGYFDQNRGEFGQYLDLDRFSSDIRAGLFLDSDIPSSYGMGSSGALCAAVYGRYGITPENPAGETLPPDPGALRSLFIRMESFFHGRSSGFDPLVSFLRRPVMVGNEGVPAVIDLPERLFRGNDFGIFLVDSGGPCSTGSLVGGFLERYAPGGAVTPAGDDLCRITDACIRNFLQGDPGRFMPEAGRLSRFQLKALESQVPFPLNSAWHEGLITGLFTMKLCGSGGGGYVLCFTTSPGRAEDYFACRGFSVLKVTG
jgi:mevalonate kinase